VRTGYLSSGAVHFSTRGEYGVRLMVELARHQGEGPISLADVAAHEELPRPYLEQLVVSLRSAGLVSSTRGARGGYVLARSPEDIRLGEVLRALEGPIVPMACASDSVEHSTCSRTTFCGVNVLWVRVRDAINAAVDSFTLADLVAQHLPAPVPDLAVSAGVR
jgi:Rrf2 family transcriptional regulator, cysteine metabolism repressor